jgi:hypothetical protein
MAFSYRISIASDRPRDARMPTRLERKIRVAFINNLPRQKLPSKKQFPN